MTPTRDFEKWAKGFAGCDGGNLRGSVWFCGIEWGTGADHQLGSEVKKQVSEPPRLYETPETILQYPYGIKLIKLIAAMRGSSVSDYRRFAYEEPFPFSKDSDYFKLNLFPVAFQRVDSRLWVDSYKDITGLATREAYLDWCREHRFPQFRSWIDRGKPKLIVATGTAYKDDYRQAFGFGNTEHEETLEGLRFSWLSRTECILAIVPFLGWQNGLLNSDQKLQAFGERLANLLSGHEI